jgi:hypothetical protein
MAVIFANEAFHNVKPQSERAVGNRLIYRMKSKERCLVSKLPKTSFVDSSRSRKNQREIGEKASKIREIESHASKSRFIEFRDLRSQVFESYNNRF